MGLVPATEPILAVIEQIVLKNAAIAGFWSSAHGWAPLEAAGLLSRSRLDRQVSLSRTLVCWVPPEADVGAADAVGRLILGWVNLGSLVEGTLKWFLSVYYEDHRSDVNAMRKHGKVQNPDGVQLEQLRVFFKKSVWRSEEQWDTWILRVQNRRNAIHSYKDRDIGTVDELQRCIREYLDVVEHLDGLVPYPEGSQDEGHRGVIFPRGVPSA